jgi:hypothetical protein
MLPPRYFLVWLVGPLLSESVSEQVDSGAAQWKDRHVYMGATRVGDSNYCSEVVVVKSDLKAAICEQRCSFGMPALLACPAAFP